MNLQVIAVVSVISIALIGSGTYLMSSQIDARIDAELTAGAEKTRADIAENSLTRIEEGLEAEKARQARLAAALQTARDYQGERKKILADRDRLTKLTQAKPGLMEIRAREATTALWKDIEGLSRE